MKNIAIIGSTGYTGIKLVEILLKHPQVRIIFLGSEQNADSKYSELVPAFKNARFWVHRSHWEWANSPNPREKASFLSENILPLKESGQLKFIEGSGGLLSNTPFPFSIILVNGHTEKQMLPVIEYQGKRILIKGQFKDNLLDGEWTLWAWNNDREEPGCTEVWSNGQLKSIEVFYDYFLKINMKGKYINQGKKSIIAGELCYYSGLKIENITRSNKI